MSQVILCSPSISVFRGFPTSKAFRYICAQILEVFCAVWITYGIYHNAIVVSGPEQVKPETDTDQTHMCDFELEGESTSSSSGTALFALAAPFTTLPTDFWTDFTVPTSTSGMKGHVDHG